MGVKPNILDDLPANSPFLAETRVISENGSSPIFEIGTSRQAIYTPDSTYAGKNFTVTYLARSNTVNARFEFQPWGGIGAANHQATTSWQQFTEHGQLDKAYTFIYFWALGDYSVDVTNIVMTIDD